MTGETDEVIKLKSDKKELEKENKKLRRKEKALAEMAALYTLKKKRKNTGRRTRTKNRPGRQVSRPGTYCRSKRQGGKSFQGLRGARHFRPHIQALEE